MDITDDRLVMLRERLPPALWEARVEAAQAEASKLQEVSARVKQGEAAVHVLEEVFPDRNAVHLVRRLRAYEAGGAQALIDRRFVERKSRVTPEVQAAVRAALAARPELRSPQLCAIVRESLGAEIPESTMRQWLRSQGLSQRTGNPGRGTGGALGSTPLAYAGAELLKALDDELGATRALTDAMTEVLEALPAPEGPVHDDRAGRDATGRFTAAYNEPEIRTTPELGPRFASVEEKRASRDLPAMRVAHTSAEARHRKDRALTFLPLVVEGTRWTELRHWRGQHLETLVGFPFQPSTLDKYARQLKYAAVARAMQQRVASFWAEQGEADDGCVSVLYCDAFTKPIWTHHYTLSTRVSRTGRVQPATTTFFLHVGAGTPVIYRSYPGHASLPKHVCAMLAEWEEVAGAGTARRLVVIDREGHSAALLKELDAKGWWYLLPVRRNVTRSKGAWDSEGAWTPLDPEVPEGPAVREGTLCLRDSKAKGSDEQRTLRVRAIRRRSDPDDEGATWVTNAPSEVFTPQELLELYNARWPRQEHVFRDANGRVGLHRHHGYGKRKIAHIAVIDEREKLLAQAKRAREHLGSVQAELAQVEEQHGHQQRAVEAGSARIASLLSELGEHLAGGGPPSDEIREKTEFMEQWQSWLTPARERLVALEQERATLRNRAHVLLARAKDKDKRHDELARKTEIFTVDVQLDEIMTAYKLTFLNLCSTLMREYLEVDWQIDHLIRAVLTLPGRRRTTPQVETIEIFRQERDPEAMAAVERACASFNAKELRRGERRLRFAVIDSP